MPHPRRVSDIRRLRCALRSALVCGALLAAPASGQVEWDGSCGDDDWHTCCNADGGGKENNWDFGSEQSCPLPLPGPNDDVDLGGGVVTLRRSPEEINSLMSQGVLRIGGVDLVITQGAILSEFTLLGGGLHAGGIVDIAGPFDWRGGQIAHLGDPPVQTMFRGGLMLSGSGGILNGRQTISTAGTTWTDGNFSLNQGSSFDNQDTFTIKYGKLIRGTGAVFINSGTLSKIESPGVTLFTDGVALRNTATGMLDIQTGTIRLEGGGENSGGISLSEGTILRFKSRTFEFLEDTDVEGPGLFWVEGGTVQQAGADVRVSMEKLRVSGGTLRGPGTYIPMNMEWTGGTLDGAGDTFVRSLVIDGALRKTLSNHVLFSDGPTTWNGAGTMFIQSGAVLCNCGTMQLVGQQKNVRFDTGEWINDGTLNVFTDTLFGIAGSGGVLTNAEDSIMNIGPGVTTCELKSGTLFRHFGRVNIESPGTLLVRGGDSGTAAVFHIAGGAELEFRSQLFECDRTQFTGDGLVRIFVATVDFQSGKGPGSTSIKNLKLTGGTITGAGEVSITNQFDWEGGQMTGTGSTISTNVMNIDGVGTLTITQRTLKNEGQANWLGADIVLNDGARFHNAAGAIVDAETTADFRHTTGANGVVDNDGIFHKLTGGGTLLFPSGVEFHNKNSVNLQSGIIRIAGGGTSTGVFGIAAGSTVDFASDPYLIDDGTGFVGVGAARLVSGKLTVNGAEVEAQIFKMQGGVLDGPGTLKITGSFGWTGGTMEGPRAGTTRSDGTMNISGTSDKKISERMLLNEGTANWSGAHTIFLNNGAKFINDDGATFNDQSGTGADFRHATGDSGTFINRGTYRKTDDSTTRFIGVRFNNPAGGILDIENDADVEFFGGGSSAGRFLIDGLSRVKFKGDPYILDGGARIVGTGFAEITDNGTLTVNGEVEAQKLALEDAMLNGPGTLTVTQRLEWRGGSTMSGSGRTINGANSTMFIVAPTNFLTRRRIQNLGTTEWLGGDIAATFGGDFRNEGAFIVTAFVNRYEGDEFTTFINKSRDIFTNNVRPGETATMAIRFLNDGKVINKRGQLRFQKTFVNNSGTIIVEDGSIYFREPLVILGGKIGGENGRVLLKRLSLRGGFITPGDSPGTFTVDGDYDQGIDATMEIELAGLVPGDQHDVLVVTGDAELGGTLQILLLDGFDPQIGDTFEVMTFATRVGEFDTVESPDLGDGKVIRVQYNDTNVTLVTTLPADFDLDFDVDLDDYERLFDCLIGPGGGVPEGCDQADLDGSGEITLKDFARLQRGFTG